MVFIKTSRRNWLLTESFIAICFQQEIEGSKYPRPIKVVDYLSMWNLTGHVGVKSWVSWIYMVLSYTS